MRSMHWKSLLAAVGMSLLAAPVFADQPQDAYLTSKVKIQLMKADGINSAMSINVDTLDSVVTLQGKVETAAEREKAAQEARGVKGVKEVRDMLAVVPKSAKEQVNASDDQIQKRIETVFEQDTALKESSIKVASVNKGIVVLSGKADTLSSHQRAITDARGVPGVRKVASEIQSPDKLGDKEIWSDEPSTAAQAKSSASDTWVTTKVKTKLLAEPGLNPLKINVDTRDGIVTLFGNVNSANEKTVAEQQTRKIDGVKSVQNELQVVAESAEKVVAARDDQVQDAVKKRIGEREGLKDDNIDIEVKNGVVRLTGTVSGFGDRMTALTVARSTKGVKSVIDDLRIEQKG